MCAQEEHWEYEFPIIDVPTSTLVFSLDEAYLLMANEGCREAMLRNISLYENEGERQHTIYFGVAPEYGKTVFKKYYETEIKCLGTAQ